MNYLCNVISRNWSRSDTNNKKVFVDFDVFVVFGIRKKKMGVIPKKDEKTKNDENWITDHGD